MNAASEKKSRQPQFSFVGRGGRRRRLRRFLASVVDPAGTGGARAGFTRPADRAGGTGLPARDRAAVDALQCFARPRDPRHHDR